MNMAVSMVKDPRVVTRSVLGKIRSDREVYPRVELNADPLSGLFVSHPFALVQINDNNDDAFVIEAWRASR